MTVDVNQFITAVFPPLDLAEGKGVIGICEGTFRCVEHEPERTQALVSGRRPTYMVVSTLDGRKRLTKEGTESSDLGRARSNCLEAWVFVLDDVGTKAIAPLVEPSYKIQTSFKEGVPNYQWGYFLEPYDVSTPEGVTYYEACCRAAGIAGISDRGMRGVYRICRVPGSLHDSGFRAAIADWNPKRMWKLPELMRELGLDVDAAMKSAGRRSGRNNLGSVTDPILDWLSLRGDVGETQGEWVSIVCPNHAEHSDGSEVAGYSPLDYESEGRQFKCFHGHCDAWDTKKFLDWVAENGGPSVGAFGPDPVTAEERSILRSVIPTAEIPAEIAEEMEIEAVREEILRDWYYSEGNRSYFRLGADGRPCELMGADGFNNRHGKWMPPTRDGRKVAVRWWRESDKAQMVQSIEFRPDKGPGIYMEGDVRYMNSYIKYEPKNVVADSEISGLWDRHIRLLFGDEADLLMSWMAWVVQHPEARINWCPVLQGIPGCGKTMIGQALAAAVGRHYVAEIGPSAFGDSFNTFMEGKLLVLGEEIRVSGQNRFAVLDSLKTLLTNDYIDVRGMHKARRTILNTASYMVFTNHDDAIPLDHQERRWAVFSARIETREEIAEAGMDQAYFGELKDSIDKSHEAIRAWLLSLDIQAFDPKNRAPETKGAAMMIEYATDSLYEQVFEELISGRHLNANDAIFTNLAVQNVVDLLNRRGGISRKLSEESRWRSYLRAQGWVNREAKYRCDGVPTRVWVNRKMISEGGNITAEKISAVLANRNSLVTTVSNVVDFQRGEG